MSGFAFSGLDWECPDLMVDGASYRNSAFDLTGYPDNFNWANTVSSYEFGYIILHRTHLFSANGEVIARSIRAALPCDFAVFRVLVAAIGCLGNIRCQIRLDYFAITRILCERKMRGSDFPGFFDREQSISFVLDIITSCEILKILEFMCPDNEISYLLRIGEFERRKLITIHQ